MISFLLLSEPIQATKESYNQSAAAYAEKTSSFSFTIEMELFCASLPSGAAILDLGCGAGRDAKRFSDKGFSVTGIDFSEELLAIAKQAAPNAAFLLQDLNDLSNFAPASFNGVWANASLLHLEKSRLSKALSQIYTLLKPGGVFFLSMKKGEGEGIVCDERYGGIPKYFAYYQPDALSSLLEEAGFAVTSLSLDLSSGGAYQTHPFIQILARKPEQPALSEERLR